MKLIVLGHKQHGKDTACEYLRDTYGVTFTSSSEMACHLFLFDQLKDKYGYQTPEECFADRHSHREEWFNAIVAYNTPDPTRLGRQIFAEKDVYCGIRSAAEFDALREAGLFDVAVWVDASKRKPLESAKSMQLTERDANFYIDNNLSLEDLHYQLDGFYKYVIEQKKHKEIYQPPVQQRHRMSV